MTHNLTDILRLVLVTDDVLVRGRDLVALCCAAERGGVTAVQLRLKEATARDLAAAARALKSVLTVPLFINDRLDVAVAAGAAGAHLGPDDLPLLLARRAAPPGFLIGASVGSSGDAVEAQSADYWGIGPLHATASKSDAGVPLDVNGFARLARLAPSDLPCIAIGGVLPQDVASIREAGGTGVAVIRGILASQSVEEMARAYAVAGQMRRRAVDRRSGR
ncbi:MAG TPA: thiamine phosphate synthase [Nitrospira sp.]|nr:thiamine phosphate synthase [Nitrospira sp.]